MRPLLILVSTSFLLLLVRHLLLLVRHLFLLASCFFVSIGDGLEPKSDVAEPKSLVSRNRCQVQQAKVGRHLDFTMQTVLSLRKQTATLRDERTLGVTLRTGLLARTLLGPNCKRNLIAMASNLEAKASTENTSHGGSKDTDMLLQFCCSGEHEFQILALPDLTARSPLTMCATYVCVERLSGQA